MSFFLFLDLLSLITSPLTTPLPPTSPLKGLERAFVTATVPLTDLVTRLSEHLLPPDPFVFLYKIELNGDDRNSTMDVRTIIFLLCLVLVLVFGLLAGGMNSPPIGSIVFSFLGGGGAVRALRTMRQFK